MSRNGCNIANPIRRIRPKGINAAAVPEAYETDMRDYNARGVVRNTEQAIAYQKA